MKTFRNTLVFVWKIHQSLVDSRHERPVTGTLDIFFVVNQSKLQNKRSYWDDRDKIGSSFITHHNFPMLSA